MTNFASPTLETRREQKGSKLGAVCSGLCADAEQTPEQSVDSLEQTWPGSKHQAFAPSLLQVPRASPLCEEQTRVLLHVCSSHVCSAICSVLLWVVCSVICSVRRSFCSGVFALLSLLRRGICSARIRVALLMCRIRVQVCFRSERFQQKPCA